MKWEGFGTQFSYPGIFLEGMRKMTRKSCDSYDPVEIHSRCLLKTSTEHCCYTIPFGKVSNINFTGAVGLIWFAIWWNVVKDGPEEDARISPQELKYIQDSLGNTSLKVTLHLR
jgi:hypothetical protein